MSAATPTIFLLNSTSTHQSKDEQSEVDYSLLLWGPKRDTLWVVVPVTVYYVIIFISGVVGNVCTCVVVARNKHMHTATNYYLFSLAISDLLLLVSGMPTEMYHIWSNYPYVFGETFCVLTGFASETSTNATVLTITAFTIERYVAICHPFLSHTVSKLSRAVKYIMVIWVLSLCLAVPQAIQMGIFYPLDDNGNIETEEYSACTVKYSIIPYSFFVSTVVFFLTPMTLITVLYVLIGVRLHRSSQITEGGSQRRRALLSDKEAPLVVRGSQRNGPHSKSTKRVVKMLVAVVVAFFVCWAPFHLQRLHSVFGFAGDDTTHTAYLVHKVMTYASGIFYYLSTTINPILYNIMSLKFRQAFKSTLTKCLGRDRLRHSGDLASCGGGSLGAEEITKIGIKMRSITMKWKCPKRNKEVII
ncbi:pyrokinin-1 receptor-like isoform X2 [Homalodisca vitripennis]|uniref:pyrokinin-1 receptor-like isoform X2 n=1 Tax=Homalodisca vitripennis TaxID=197043 RepID=UPI001EEBEC20|nr:pyrokinin-1 receptor-like isoform X2 [Homalodisca vitripennis]